MANANAPDYFDVGKARRVLTSYLFPIKEVRGDFVNSKGKIVNVTILGAKYCDMALDDLETFLDSVNPPPVAALEVPPAIEGNENPNPPSPVGSEDSGDSCHSISICLDAVNIDKLNLPKPKSEDILPFLNSSVTLKEYERVANRVVDVLVRLEECPQKNPLARNSVRQICFNLNVDQFTMIDMGLLK